MKALFTLLLVSGMVVVGSWVKPDSPRSDDWLTIEEALVLQQTAPKKWFVDIYTDWCGWCKRLEATTFKDAKILEQLDAHYYKVRFDAEYKKTIRVGEKEYKFIPNGRRGYHELASLFLNGKMSYPTVVFINEEMQIIQPLSGYRSAEELHPILQYFGEGHHKTKTFEAFKESYQNPY